MYSVIMCSPIANQKMLSEIDSIETLAQLSNNTGSMSLVYWYAVHILKGPAMSVTRIVCVCVISQGRLSRPMMCLRSRSAALRMFFTTILAMA